MPPPARVPITPELKVGELLKAYPELEPVLIAQAPAFANLTNPVLRRTVAKIASLAQAARVGGIDVRDLVRALRRAAGHEGGDDPVAAGTAEGVAPAPPDWFSADAVVGTVNADVLLAAGTHPLGEVTRLAHGLAQGEVVCVTSSFVPAPLVDVLRGQGYEVVTFEHGASGYTTCIRRAP